MYHFFFFKTDPGIFSPTTGEQTEHIAIEETVDIRVYISVPAALVFSVTLGVVVYVLHRRYACSGGRKYIFHYVITFFSCKSLNW